jgi:hypothetical protein
MDYDDTYEQMNITLGDSDDVTFTPEEKARALQRAWKDSYVVKRVQDSTLTFTTGTNSYAVPSTIDNITDISLSPSNSLTTDFPETIPSDLWEVIDGYIKFKNQANSIIPSGYTLYLKGNYKYDYTADTLTGDSLQEYVIALGAYNTLTALAYKKVNLFLKNDTTLSELIALKRDLKQEVLELRAKLQRSYEGA